MIYEAATEDSNLNQRFVHEWNNTNDGVFVMKLNDFLKHFNQLTLSRSLTPEFTEFKYLKTMKTSKGPFSIKN